MTTGAAASAVLFKNYGSFPFKAQNSGNIKGLMTLSYLIFHSEREKNKQSNVLKLKSEVL